MCQMKLWQNLTFQHSAARRRLERYIIYIIYLRSFNTQPPEGGWIGDKSERRKNNGFNTQPPEGGWQKKK